MVQCDIGPMMIRQLFFVLEYLSVQLAHHAINCGIHVITGAGGMDHRTFGVDRGFCHVPFLLHLQNNIGVGHMIKVPDNFPNFSGNIMMHGVCDVDMMPAN